MADITQQENFTANAPSERVPKPIAEFAGREDYPQCTLGQFVDIGGVEGEIFDIVSNSLKLRTTEGRTQSFNYHTVKKLYGPVVHIEPVMPRKEEEPPATPPPAPLEIPNPDFDQELKSISEFTGQADFPQCTLGKLVEINGYVGVVVEIQDQSMKVRSRNGTSRKYNGEILRKLHGKPA